MSEERFEFSRRLAQAMSMAGYEPRPAVLFRLFNARYPGRSVRFQSTARGLGFAAMLGTLYAALYGLLLSEDNALVMGAGLLFAILAAIMVATRKVDWYQLSAKAGTPGGAI